MDDPASKLRTVPRRWPRRALAVLVTLTLAVPGLWLLSHTIPRSTWFIERRGVVAAAQPANEITTDEGYISQAVRVTSTTGLAVELRVLRPAVVTNPLPLVVLLGGHRTGRNAVDIVGDPRGIVIAALDYPYHGPERIRGLAQSLRTVPAVQRGLLDTPPAVSLALDWLLTQPWVDHERVELMGVSLGVPFAAVAGALDDRFRRVWLIHGGVDNRAWLANRLESKIPNRLLRESSATLLHLLAYGSSFETERWSPLIAPRSVIVIGASDDEQMPPANVAKLFAATGSPKELLWTAGQHIRPSRPKIVQELLALVRSRIVEPDLSPKPGD